MQRGRASPRCAGSHRKPAEYRGRAGDDAKNLGRRALLLKSLAQGPLDIGIRGGRTSGAMVVQDRATSPAERLYGWALLLASGAFHAHSPRAGRGSGSAGDSV